MIFSTMLSAARDPVLRHARHILQASRKSNRNKQSYFARLISSLAVLEQRDGKLQTASLSAVTAARKLGGPITGFIAGSGIRAVAKEAAEVKGMDKVIVIENVSYDRVSLLFSDYFTSHF